MSQPTSEAEALDSLARFHHALIVFIKSCKDVFDQLPPDGRRTLSPIVKVQQRARVQAIRLLLQRHEREARLLRRLLRENGE